MACARNTVTELGIPTNYFMVLPEDQHDLDEILPNYDSYMEFALQKYLDLIVSKHFGSRYEPRLINNKVGLRGTLTVTLYENQRLVRPTKEQREIITKGLKDFEPYAQMVVMVDGESMAKSKGWDIYWLRDMLWLIDIDFNYEPSIWHGALYAHLDPGNFDEDYVELLLLINYRLDKMYNKGVWWVPSSVEKEVIENWQLQPYHEDDWPEDRRYLYPDYTLFNTTLTPHNLMRELLTSEEGEVQIGFNILDNYVAMHAIAKALQELKVTPVFYNSQLWVKVNNVTTARAIQKIIEVSTGLAEGKVARLSIKENNLEPLLKYYSDSTWYQTLDPDNPLYISILLPFEAEPITIEQQIYKLITTPSS